YLLPDHSWEAYWDRLPSTTELSCWFQSSLINIAVVVGNGLVVIDFDVQEVFDYWYSMYPIKTYMVKTRRGMHVYLKTRQPANNYHSELLDIKAERGYVLTPPSIHPSGYQYQVFMQSELLEIETLEDILPVIFTPEPEKVQAKVDSILPDDPWAIAENADVERQARSVGEVRASINILKFFPHAEQSSRDGRWWVTLCPFHNDKRPSFWIDTKRQICGCRKCNIKEMDVIDLYARLNNLSNRDAIKTLAGKI
ncbi:MAG: bifunctional DNA primase/polymerase, partial [Bacteroidales bacterium]